jgi:hypothetical protein
MTMASIVTEDASAPAVDTDVTRPHAWIDAPAVPEAPVLEDGLLVSWPAGVFEDLDDPSLVLSEGYIGADRRSPGLWSRLRRGTFPTRRSLLRLEALVVALVAVVVVGALVLVRPEPATSGAASGTDRSSVGSGSAAPATASTTPAPVLASPAAAPTPSTTTPVTAVPAAAPPAVTTPPVPEASTTPLTPDQMGAQALALVRYPWQTIPGYTIQFEPISAAPSPGFYGNTTFTWGHTGGTSVLYVYPGETVQRLAGITAFEIAHEVDAAAVQPQGGEAQIENVLGIHPSSWAPNCDCAEQGFLSGWYAAAFSNYWSPGVGDWSPLAPMPTGTTLTAVEPWLNPTIP